MSLVQQSRITIDVTSAVHQSAGIGRLTRETIKALLALPLNYEMRLFCMGNISAEGLGNYFGSRPHASLRYFVSPITDRWFHRFWYKARLPIPVEWFCGGHCELYHATDFVLPPHLPSTKTVLTVHDLTFERDPGSAMPTLLSFLRRVVPQSARQATHIIADSFATARDLIELYNIPAEKITTIHSGVNARFCVNKPRQTTPTHRMREKYAIGAKPFILAVGTMQRRKNHLGLVRAYAKMVQNWQNDDMIVPDLVIAGGKGWLYDEVLNEVKKLDLVSRVKFIGFVADDDLPDLYRTASVFAFPSLYEGFGLPILEAMACGVPVVASNASSLPEVVGDAGLQVSPSDTDALATALVQAYTNTQWREQAITAGLARSQTFTWEKSAQQLLAVYEHVLSQKSK